jgi:hypothetical protein
MKNLLSPCNNQNGIATVIVIMVLALMTALGLMVTRTSTTEMQISTSDKIHKISFYAAEAAKGYVALNYDLYSSANIDPDNPVGFPDAGDPYAKQILDAGSNQSYNGHVVYLKESKPPRGSGFQAGKFKAHVYEMECTGYGPRSTESTIEAGFYRIGF